MDAHDEMIVANIGDMPSYEELCKAIKEQCRHISSLRCGFGTTDAINSLDELVDVLESKLAASEEARKKAETELVGLQCKYDLMKFTAEVNLKACEAAEQRIKASEDQEPAFVIHDELGNTHNLYKQPPIPPELSEVVRERDELRRKLAEQQALNDSLETALDDFGQHKNGCTFADVLPTGEGTWGCSCGLDTAKFGAIGKTELTKLLEEAKRQAVPEGMVLLPISCPECGGKDIEYARMCHNSKCKGYAMEFSVYEGWRSAAPQPHKD